MCSFFCLSTAAGLPSPRPPPPLPAILLCIQDIQDIQGPQIGYRSAFWSVRTYMQNTRGNDDATSADAKQHEF